MPYIIILLIIIIILSILLCRKQILDDKEQRQYQQTLVELDLKKRTIEADLEKNWNILNQQIKEQEQQVANFEQNFNNIKLQRQEELENEIEAKRADKEETLRLQFKQLEAFYTAKLDQVKAETDTKIAELTERHDRLQEDVNTWENSYNGLINSYKIIEQNKMEKLFYTIQIPEEYKEDMNFLLNTVAPQVKHPDIISKLVWQEYVKPALDATFKRINIEDKSGIYKLTYLENNKSYIGKSTNVKKRIADHFKSAIGIESIADQAIHHEMLRTGIWNWTIEVIGYFPKEQLNEKEKFYIKEFDCINYGFNKNSGG